MTSVSAFYWIIEPIKNLRYRGQINTGYSGSNYRSASLPYSSGFTSASENYNMSMSENEGSSMVMENTLSYILPQLGKNTIDVMVGQSFERSNWSSGMNMAFTVAKEVQYRPYPGGHRDAGRELRVPGMQLRRDEHEDYGAPEVLHPGP